MQFSLNRNDDDASFVRPTPAYKEFIMRKEKLLAKSHPRKGVIPDYALLTNHTRDVADAGDTLLIALGRAALANAGLPASTWGALEKSARLSFWLQDLGKANSHFHDMLEGKPEFTQILRHEAISGLIVMQTPIREWLIAAGYNLDTLHPALWSAVGHHRKFGGNDKAGNSYLEPKTADPAVLYLGHPDFQAILTEMAERLGIREGLSDLLHNLSPLLTIGTGRSDACDIAAPKAIQDLKAECKRWSEDHGDPEYDRFIAINKAIGIAADVCASAYARTPDAEAGRPIAEFVAESLAAGLGPADLDELMWRYAWDRADEEVIRPENPDGFPPGFEFRQFQRDVAEADSDSAPQSLLTLAVAGCGSGKSLAAYLWGRRWCQAWADEGRTNFRFHFTLPTTGTATEHFKDYALACGVSPQLKGLSHSRSSVDLTYVAQETAAQEEGRGGSDAIRQAGEMLKAQADKIESLDLWGTPLVVGTADTALGLMANARRSVYSFPALMQSAFVFDEIHAYDEELFGHLLMFLETFPRIPVLLMTASLPKARREAIAGVRRDLRIVNGPEEHETRRRYEVPQLMGEDRVRDLIRSCLSDPTFGKVLWVRNQVGWAVQAYRDCHEQLSDFAPTPFIGLYHSRFRYKDRAKVHADVIRNFKRSDRPCILVATQVAEMSLDLSADLLITDLAPIPALIQRLGRLNRFAETDEDPSGVSIFCEPSGPLPYNEEDLKRSRKWLGELMKEGRRLSQRDLSEAFSGFDVGRTVDLQTARRRAVFMSGLWKTFPASTRGEGYTMHVVLEADHENYPKDKLQDYAYRRNWLREHEVSIPIRNEMHQWDVFGQTPIAPRDAITYGQIDSKSPVEKRTGAAWAD